MVNRKFIAALWCILVSSLPVWGQDKLHPLKGTKENPVLLASDRSSVVVEKAFQHKSTLGSPPDDRASFFPETRASLVVLWLRIQNVSRSPLNVNVAKFTVTDDQGRTFAALAPDEASKRILADAAASIGTKALRGISLGRAGSNLSEEDMKEDLDRYSLHSSPVPIGASREGFIYFERPAQKKFTLDVRLGDHWSPPIRFSTEKQK